LVLIGIILVNLDEQTTTINDGVTPSHCGRQLFKFMEMHYCDFFKFGEGITQSYHNNELCATTPWQKNCTCICSPRLAYKPFIYGHSHGCFTMMSNIRTSCLSFAWSLCTWLHFNVQMHIYSYLINSFAR
jgi:hypothetical protein